MVFPGSPSPTFFNFLALAQLVCTRNPTYSLDNKCCIFLAETIYAGLKCEFGGTSNGKLALIPRFLVWRNGYAGEIKKIIAALGEATRELGAQVVSNRSQMLTSAVS
jgi:hypothetical protein